MKHSVHRDLFLKFNKAPPVYRGFFSKDQKHVGAFWATLLRLKVEGQILNSITHVKV